jgi:hypothetical protein
MMAAFVALNVQGLLQGFLKRFGLTSASRLEISAIDHTKA